MPLYNLVAINTRVELASVDFNATPSVYVSEAGVEKVFDWRPGNYTSRVSADTAKGIVVASTIVPPSTGAWVSSRYFDYDTRPFGTSGSQAIAAIETVGGGVYRVGGGVPQPSLPPSYTGTVVEYDGPSVPINFFAESGEENKRAKRALKMQHTGPHIGQILSGFHIQSAVNGSGANGPNNASVGASISTVKKNAASASAAVGEIDGFYSVVRQGGPSPTNRNNSSDWSNCLLDSTGFGNCGHGFNIEGALRNYDLNGNLLYQVQTQVGGLETNWAAYNADGSLTGNPMGVRYVYGFNAQMVTGQGDVAYLVEGSANWKSAFRVNAVEASAVFDIRNTGEFWQGSGANRIKHKHQSGAAVLTNSADVQFAKFSPSSSIIGTSSGKVGFYDSEGTEKQTGVAVTVEAIHEALVNLNLISG